MKEVRMDGAFISTKRAKPSPWFVLLIATLMVCSGVLLGLTITRYDSRSDVAEATEIIERVYSRLEHPLDWAESPYISRPEVVKDTPTVLMQLRLIVRDEQLMASLSEELQAKAKKSLEVIDHAIYLRDNYLKGKSSKAFFEVEYRDGRYYVFDDRWGSPGYEDGVCVDDNGFEGTGYGSIDEPTEVQPLATIAGTGGRPIDSGSCTVWDGPPDA